MSEDPDVYQPSEAMQAELAEHEAVTRVRLRVNRRKKTKTIVMFLQLRGEDGPSVEAKLFGVPLDDLPEDPDEAWRGLLKSVRRLEPKERRAGEGKR